MPGNREQMLTPRRPQLAVSLPSHSSLVVVYSHCSRKPRHKLAARSRLLLATDLSGLFVGQLQKTLGFWILEKQLNAVSPS